TSQSPAPGRKIQSTRPVEERPMPDRLALVIAVSTYQDPGIPSAAGAEADADAFARALAPLGFPPDGSLVLLGSQATKTAVESRLRKLAKAPPALEALYVFYAGHAFTAGKKGYLTCFDSQLDDLVETSVPLKALLDVLKGCKAPQTALFL